MRWTALLACLCVACRSAPPPCAVDAQRAEVAAPLNITLYADQTLQPDDVAQLLAGLDDWARCANVNLHVQRRPSQAFAPPFTLSAEALAKLQPQDAPRALTGSLVTLVRRVALPGPHVVVVLLPDLAPPSSAASAVLPELVGLGLPAALTLDQAPPWMRALPSPRSPLVLLSARQLQVLPSAERASAVGHELGHAMGLSHDARRCNLMAATANCGVGWLDAAQAQRLRP